MYDIQSVIVGAGVVGLAIARTLSKHGLEVLVLEQHAHIGFEVSSRNSEVIHAGIYYPKDSLKANLCLRGKNLLYDFCQHYHVPHQKIGKLIIAHGIAGQHQLAKLQANAKACGLHDLQLLDAAQARAIEPQVQCDAALYSPSTGIIDSHSLMLSLQGLSEQDGAQIVLNTPVSALRRHPDSGFIVDIQDQDYQLHCQYLINAAGIHAPQLGTALTPTPIVQKYCKGHYFSYQGANPFNHLIYPLPDNEGLGVHSCQDLAGQLRFGPDVQWVDEINYDPDPARRTLFYETIRKYWPDIEKERLQPDFCGIRPKVAGPGEPAADFQILGPKNHQIPGLVQLYGIESPGLTACLAIGEYVQQQLQPSQNTDNATTFDF